MNVLPQTQSQLLPLQPQRQQPTRMRFGQQLPNNSGTTPRWVPVRGRVLKKILKKAFSSCLCLPTSSAVVSPESDSSAIATTSSL
ncbi:hypothetical protein LOK49_LG03G01109 [Camellia lanceoleosa]|uniref:Uncharacterized protein n=1 Tax=Camellia lanceoleosa TaxID=1840588 RepID=A0ACC0I6F1_9ERIC|nr:hypothetical protein LOK49_LG03G01109 [Camellia lanceoleosa]